MTDTKRESLSALIDGEATEIEIHRLVREFRDDESLTASWAVFQQIRTTVRSRTDGPGLLTATHHQNLLGRISGAIQDEETFQRQSAPKRPNVRVIGGSLALAASLVIAVFIGVQFQTGSSEGAAIAQDTTMRASGDPASGQVVAQTVATGPTPELVELDEEKQKRLRSYLNQHERMSRTTPDTQLVDFKEFPSR